MLKIGMGYNIVSTHGINIQGVRVDEKGKDGGDSYVKGRIYFRYSADIYVLSIYLHDNQDFICYTDGMIAKDSAKSINSESKMFHIIIKYTFNPEIKRINIK